MIKALGEDAYEAASAQVIDELKPLIEIITSQTEAQEKSKSGYVVSFNHDTIKIKRSE